MTLRERSTRDFIAWTTNGTIRGDCPIPNIPGKAARYNTMVDRGRDEDFGRFASAGDPGLPPLELSPAESASCDGCHPLQDLVANPRPGYAHFERVHRAVNAEERNCGACHRELSPFDAANHVIDRQLQTQNCVHCHLVVE